MRLLFLSFLTLGRPFPSRHSTETRERAKERTVDAHAHFRNARRRGENESGGGGGGGDGEEGDGEEGVKTNPRRISMGSRRAARCSVWLAGDGDPRRRLIGHQPLRRRCIATGNPTELG